MLLWDGPFDAIQRPGMAQRGVGLLSGSRSEPTLLQHAICCPIGGPSCNWSLGVGRDSHGADTRGRQIMVLSRLSIVSKHHLS
jgi:hypothetical protein